MNLFLAILLKNFEQQIAEDDMKSLTDAYKAQQSIFKSIKNKLSNIILKPKDKNANIQVHDENHKFE